MELPSLFALKTLLCPSPGDSPPGEGVLPEAGGTSGFLGCLLS